MTDTLSGKIEEITAARDEKLGELEAQYSEIEKRYDEELAAKLEPVIKEGQQLETKLQEQIGEAPRKAITSGVPQTPELCAIGSRAPESVAFHPA